MTSLDNLEKLIQMATIEHMYSMLQKMTNNTNCDSTFSKNRDSDFSKNCITDEFLKKIHKYDTVIDSLTVKVYDLEHCDSKIVIFDLMKKIYNCDNIISTLSVKVNGLEKELEEIKSNTNNNSKYLCQQIRGQQVLTSYPGFSNTSSKHIKSV